MTRCQTRALVGASHSDETRSQVQRVCSLCAPSALIAHEQFSLTTSEVRSMCKTRNRFIEKTAWHAGESMTHTTRRKDARVLRSLPVGERRARWRHTPCWGLYMACRLRPDGATAPCAHTATRADGIEVCGMLTARRVSAWSHLPAHPPLWPAQGHMARASRVRSYGESVYEASDHAHHPWRG